VAATHPRKLGHLVHRLSVSLCCPAEGGVLVFRVHLGFFRQGQVAVLLFSTGITRGKEAERADRGYQRPPRRDELIKRSDAGWTAVSALTKALNSTPLALTASMTLSTAFMRFRWFAFLVGESLQGDFLYEQSDRACHHQQRIL
jgi:hypothetical protein